MEVLVLQILQDLLPLHQNMSRESDDELMIVNVETYWFNLLKVLVEIICVHARVYRSNSVYMYECMYLYRDLQEREREKDPYFRACLEPDNFIRIVHKCHYNHFNFLGFVQEFLKWTIWGFD